MRAKTSTATQPLLSLCWVVVLSAVSAAAPAGKLYKIVDENGNVTFSQFPPQEKSDAARWRISPLKPAAARSWRYAV